MEQNPNFIDWIKSVYPQEQKAVYEKQLEENKAVVAGKITYPEYLKSVKESHAKLAYMREAMKAAAENEKMIREKKISRERFLHSQAQEGYLSRVEDDNEELDRMQFYRRRRKMDQMDSEDD